MQHVTRLVLTLLLTVTLSAAVGAKTDTKQSEYKRSDTNYYWKGDVLKADPTAVIIPQGEFTQKGDSYFMTPKGKAPHDIYIQVENDWIEPITPPTMPASLGVAPDAMQIREPQGDVTVALPSAPANFQPATNEMTIPNGAVVKTGANGTAAVLMGGVDSIRLIPNSSAAVQQTVTAELRTTEIDLTAGAVFSKVGKRIGEKQDYQVHTPFGVAAAKGTDFITVAMPARVDVWIAQGTVQLDQPDGKMVGSVTSEGTGALKIIRNPAMHDAHAAMMASSETMTMALDFIPTVNVYVKALDDKMAQGLKLDPTERDYLNRIKKVPCLIKLALVEPPAPPPASPPAPAPAPASITPATPPAPLVPIDIDLRPDAKVDFQGATITLEELKPKLQVIGKATPTQPITVNGQEKVKPAELKKVVGMLHAAKLSKVTVTPAAPVVPPPAAVVATPTPPAPAAAPTPPPVLTPMEIDARADGKVDFQGATLSLDDLKSKLDDLAKSSPDQPIVIKKKEKLEKGQLKKVAELCHSTKLTKITVDKTPPPAPAPVPAMPAIQTPTTTTTPMVATPEAPPATVTPPPPPMPAPKPLPPAMLLPLNLDLRPNGKVDFQGSTFTFAELKPMLEDLGKMTPNQPLVVSPQEKVTKAEIRKTIALCHEAKLTNITVVKVAPSTAPAVVDGTLPANSTQSVSMAATTADNSSVASDSALPTNSIVNPPSLVKPRFKSPSYTSASVSAPVSNGPQYTVP